MVFNSYCCKNCTGESLHYCRQKQLTSAALVETHNPYFIKASILPSVVSLNNWDSTGAELAA